MSYRRFHKTASFTVAFVILLLLFPGISAAQSEADQLQEEVTETIEVRRQTQKKEDAWAGKKAGLIARYRSLEFEKDHLEKVKTGIEERLKIKQKIVAEAERKIKESARIKEGLQAYLESIVTQLERFIKKDLPFLSKERSDRVASIQETLGRPDKAAGEKYRRVMEALQVETEYGRRVEVYKDNIDMDGQSVLADILRLGRLSLFCQTPDRKVVGHYDPAAGRWVPLSSKYRREINKAVEMARRQRTIDLVRLPIGRISIP